MERNIDYNTERKRLVMPEYGRSIQKMVDYALTIEDRGERLRCARTIVKLMEGFQGHQGEQDDLEQKLWNHLAAISEYRLDIDYPVEIERHDAADGVRERIPYPQKSIGRRHYGAVVEEVIRKIVEIEDEGERKALAGLVANQMKRNLAAWNRDIMGNEKVLDDLAEYTDGKVRLSEDEMNLISDNQAVYGTAQNNGKRKKKGR
jgi:hypothetical protein